MVFVDGRPSGRSRAAVAAADRRADLEAAAGRRRFRELAVGVPVRLRPGRRRRGSGASLVSWGSVQSGSSMSTRPSPSSSTPFEQAGRASGWRRGRSAGSGRRGAALSGAGRRVGAGHADAERRREREAGQGDGQCELVSHPEAPQWPIQATRSDGGPQRNTAPPNMALIMVWLRHGDAGGFQPARMCSLSCGQWPRSIRRPGGPAGAQRAGDRRARPGPARQPGAGERAGRGLRCPREGGRGPAGGDGGPQPALGRRRRTPRTAPALALPADRRRRGPARPAISVRRELIGASSKRKAS